MVKIRCIICESINTETSEVRSRDGSYITIVKCFRCQHIFQPLEKYRDIYTDGGFTKEARGSSIIPSLSKIGELEDKARKRFIFYDKYINSSRSFLEVGSSIGSFVNLLHVAGKEAEGLEPDPTYSAFSRQQYGFEQYTDLLEDFATHKKYGSVVTFHVIEHVQEPAVFIRKAFDLLIDGGLLIVECPSIEINSYGITSTTFWKPHLHYFSMTSLYKLIEPYFEIEDYGYVNISLFMVGRKRKHFCNRDILMPLRLRILSAWIAVLVNIFPCKQASSRFVRYRSFFLQAMIERRLFMTLFLRVAKKLLR